MPTAPYMAWAKHRPRVTFDLAASGIRAVTAADLLGEAALARDVLALSGPNDEGYAPLVAAIAAMEGVEPDRVACAAGTSGANFLAVLALVSPGDDVVIESPAYDPLLALPAVVGARVRQVPRRFEQGFQLEPAVLDAAMTPTTRLIVLTNPHNPSGAVLDAETLAAVGRSAARVGATVLVDEVYRGARLPGVPAPVSAATLDGPFVVTNSLTKAWGLPGLRLGWVVAPPRLAERVRRARDLVDVIGAFPAEQLAVRAFERLDWLTARTNGILAEHWPLVRQALDACPALEYVAPGGGMMVFPRFRDRQDAGGFVDRLRADFDTLVVPGRFFGLPEHFRLSFGGERRTVDRGLEAVMAAVRAQ